MAQNNNTTSGATKFYFNIIEGELRRKAKQDDDQQFVRNRTNKSGLEVSEFAVGSLSGILENFGVVTEEYNGKKMSSLVLNIRDVDELYIVNIPVDSKYFGTLVRRLPNIDFSSYVTISPYDFVAKDNGKRKVGISVKQNNNKVLDAFSKENPLPGVGEFPIGGDDDEVKLWGIQYTKALKQLVASQLERLNVSKVNAQVAAVAPEVDTQDNPADDLPF
jgi:hypothetical protein